MNKQISFFLSLVSVFLSSNLYASDFELANKYIERYSVFDVEALSDFYSDDAVFKDLTTEGFKKPFLLEGKKEILKKFSTSFFQNRFTLKYTATEKFESSDHHVFISEVVARTKKDDSVSYSCGKVVSIVKIANDKVVSHIDYADYDAFNKSSKNANNTCSKF